MYTTAKYSKSKQMQSNTETSEKKKKEDNIIFY